MSMVNIRRESDVASDDGDQVMNLARGYVFEVPESIA
jgi:hypothetical protein